MAISGDVVEEVTAERVFRDRLDDVEAIIGHVCGRMGFFGAEADDFRSYARLRLIDNDYAVLKKFQGKSRLTTFLYVVIGNFARDFLIQKTGKWRPSKMARRLGEDAIALERLVFRDRMGVEEAVETLRVNHGFKLEDRRVEEIMSGLPPDHFKRAYEGEQALAWKASDQPEGDERLILKERRAKLEEAKSALSQCLDMLEDEDELMLRLHFRSGLKIAEIARRLDRPQKPLYRHFQKLFERLQECMEFKGFRDATEFL